MSSSPGTSASLAGLAARRYAALPPGAGSRAPGWAWCRRQRPPRACRRPQRFARVAERGLPDAYRSWISYVQDPERDALLDGRRDDWALEDYRATWRASAGAHTLDRLLDLNLRTYLLDDLLVKADRMSMAHGLELRSPFLDLDLLEMAARLPPRLKARGLSLKRVLRAAVADIVPGPICAAPSGGSACRSTAGSGRTCADIWRRVSARRMPASRHLAPQAVDRLIAEHDSRSYNHGHALWALLTLEVFLRRQDA